MVEILTTFVDEKASVFILGRMTEAIKRDALYFGLKEYVQRLEILQ
jgi:hypothetical protein